MNAVPTLTPFHSKIALQTWTLRKNFEAANSDLAVVSSILRSIADAGFKHIEVSARGNLSLDQFLTASKEAKLHCIGAHIPCLLDLDQKDVESVIERYVDSWQRVFGSSSRPILTTMGQPYRRQITREYVRILSAASKKFSSSIETGRLCYHIYEFDFQEPDTLIALAGAGINHVVDTYYLLRHRRNTEIPLEDIFDNSLLRHGVVATHLNNIRDDGLQQCPLGEGDTNWNEIVAMLGSMPRNDRFIIEHEAEGGNGLSIAARSLKYLNSNSSLATTFSRSRKLA